MKKLLLILLISFPAYLMAQNASTPMYKGFEPIQLYFVMLTEGPNRSQDSVTAMKIQESHLANIGKLYKEGKLLVAGPFLDESKWKGIFIFKCKDAKECEELLKTDPAVSAGRLLYEIHPWMTAKNCTFK